MLMTKKKIDKHLIESFQSNFSLHSVIDYL